MSYLIIKMKKNKNQKQEEIKLLNPREARKGDKLFLVRRQQVYFVGKILK